MKGFLNKVQGKPANNGKSVDGKVATSQSIPASDTLTGTTTPKGRERR